MARDESRDVEANAVQSIFTRYLAGASYAKITEEMSRGNIPSRRRTAHPK